MATRLGFSRCFPGSMVAMSRWPGCTFRFVRARGTYNATPKVPMTSTEPMAASHIFKVLFVNQGKVYEVYARKVGHGSLFGFIEVEELVFGERSTVVLDPSEERIKSEFAGVKRPYL